MLKNKTKQRKRAAILLERWTAQHEIVDNNGEIPVYFNINRKCHYITMHWHEHIEMIYQLDGRMTATAQGEQYELKPGDMLIVNQNELHRTISLGADAPYVLIQISVQRLREMMPAFEIVHFKNYISAEEISAFPEVIQAFRQMKQAYLSQNDGYTLLFMANLYKVLYVLYRNFAYQMRPDSNEGNNRDLQRIADVMEWIQNNYRQKLTLREAAGLLGISKEHFCRIFRKYTGQTFLEYLNCYRTSRFWEDMQTSGKSFTELMEQNGILNYKVFIQTFRQMYGKTPRELRYGKRTSKT